MRARRPARPYLPRQSAMEGVFPGDPGVAIFSGPEHYITPAWYPEKADTGKVVPTWNYAVVHAYGPLRVIEDPDWLLTHLNTLTDTHEASRSTPWSVADAPKDFVASSPKASSASS